MSLKVYDRRSLSPSSKSALRSSLGITVSSENVPSPVTCFTESGFPACIISLLTQFDKPTPIQSQAWPIALKGQDFVGIAQTGSGKTLAFTLPALIHVKSQPPLKLGDGPVVLILSPTRELAMQISTECNRFGKDYGIFNSCLYGGVPRGYQQKELEKGVHIVVATPGRLIDFLEQGVTNLNKVSYLVLDEADKMLEMGFEEQIRKIIERIRKDRQTIMCSATWPRPVQALARDYLRDPVTIQVGSSILSANKNIKQYIELTDDSQKFNILLKIFEEFLSNNRKILIFTETKRKCESLSIDISQKGIKCAAIHGDKSQKVTDSKDRDSVIQNFRNNLFSVLIATDVASRGLDIKQVAVVVNYDFPNSIEDYVHRIGRTGRGGNTGIAISFFTRVNSRLAKDLISVLQETMQKVPEGLLRIKVPQSEGRRRYRSRSPIN